MSDARRITLCYAAVSSFLLTTALVGCAEKESDPMLTEIGLLPARESLVEVPIGSFLLPVPIFFEDATTLLEVSNLIQLDFDLVAIVEPEHKSRVERYRDRHGGRLRDEVIRVCRNTSRDDLMESEWSTLKAHLLDATQPLLGGLGVRRLATPRIIKEPL